MLLMLFFIFLTLLVLLAAFGAFACTTLRTFFLRLLVVVLLENLRINSLLIHVLECDDHLDNVHNDSNHEPNDFSIVNHTKGSHDSVGVYAKREHTSVRLTGYHFYIHQDACSLVEKVQIQLQDDSWKLEPMPSENMLLESLTPKDLTARSICNLDLLAIACLCEVKEFQFYVWSSKIFVLYPVVNSLIPVRIMNSCTAMPVITISSFK